MSRVRGFSLLFLLTVGVLSIGDRAQAAGEGHPVFIDSWQALVEKKPCCPTLAYAKRVVHPLKGRQTVTITRNDPARMFGESKSFFKVFELPKYKSPYAIEFLSVPFRKDRAADYWFTHFQPHVLLLDEAFKEIGSAERVPLERSGLQFIGRAAVNHGDARYLVVFTDSLNLPATTYQVIKNYSGGPASLFWNAVRPGSVEVPFNVEGRLRIKIKKD